ncbi:DUF485 domain-containing protein [Streptomyces sp. NPDC046985]|uniref:DUF485 domain-containing protein n=1 Tax=Streptomyces sp. NPDC046985 TaxID=3155377 RepID=UPI0033E7E6A1
MTDAFSSPEYPPRSTPPPPGSPFAWSPSFDPWQLEPTAGAPRDPGVNRHRDLRRLRSAYRWLRRVATLTALGYFVLFLVLSAFAPPLMTGLVSGGMTTGLLLGLLQIPVTWLAVVLYEHTARRGVDPIADRIRRQAEADAADAGRGAAR